MGNAGGGGKKLNVGGGHGGRQDACQDYAGEYGQQHALAAQQRRYADNERLGGGAGVEHLDRAVTCHCKADDTDEDRDGKGDDDPCGAHAAADLDLVFILGCHEVDKNVGHSEIAQRPCQQGEDGERAVACGLGALYVGAGGQAQIAGDLPGVCEDAVPAAGRADAEYHNDDEGEDHDKALDEAGDGGRLEAAAGGVGHDDDGAYEHRGNIACAEQSAEKLAAGGKAGGGVGHIEDDDKYRADGLYYLGVVMKALGYEIGNGQSIDLDRVAAQALCDEQPVEICTQSKADGGPARLGDAAEKGKAGDAHEQPCAHVGGLGAQSSDIGTQLSSAKIELAGVGLTPGIGNADRQHTYKVNSDRYQHDGC